MTAPAPGASPEERSCKTCGATTWQTEAGPSLPDGMPPMMLSMCSHRWTEFADWVRASILAAPPSREEAIRREERERIALDMEAHAAKLRKHTRPYDGGGWDMAADELEGFAEDIAPYLNRASAGEREGKT